MTCVVLYLIWSFALTPNFSLVSVSARFKCINSTKCSPCPPFAGFASLDLSFPCGLNTALSEWNELSSCIQSCDSVAIPFSIVSASQANPSSSLPQVHPRILWECTISLEIKVLICESKACIFKPWFEGRSLGFSHFSLCCSWEG